MMICGFVASQLLLATERGRRTKEQQVVDNTAVEAEEKYVGKADVGRRH